MELATAPREMSRTAAIRGNAGLRAEREAALVLLREGADYGQEALLDAADRRVVLRVRGLVGLVEGLRRGLSLGADAVLEREVMGDGEGPGLQIRAGFSVAEVAEEGEEDVLDDLFGVGHGDAAGEQETEEGSAELVEEGDDFIFEAGRASALAAEGDQRETDRGI